MQPILNHLWQSTLFVAAAWLLTLALRKNRAQARYWVWLAASAKFVLPFSMLIWLGSQVSWRAAPMTPQHIPTVTIEHPVQLIGDPTARAAVSHTGMPELLLLIWACGFIVIMARWGWRWSRMRAEVRASRALDIEFPGPVRTAATLREPGVFGIFRPVLLLPAGIVETLTSVQLQTVLAHELCHVRRRDNLAMAIHAAIQALFWFHPLVWWIGVKLIEERERACDEDVVRGGSDPETYAEGILNVCKLYLAAPSECVAGVTGSNLNQRIEEIMSNRIKPGLGAGKKFLLAASSALAIAAPLAVGLMQAPPIRAQEKASAQFSFETISIKLRTKGDGRLTFPTFQPGGRFVSSAPIAGVIAEAYDVPFQGQRLTGGPDWVRGEIYDIEATSPQGALPESLTQTERDERARSMLRRMLMDRFKLVARIEAREMAVYALTVAKGGARLQRADIDEKGCAAPLPAGQIPCHEFNGGRGRGMHARAATIVDTANFAENWTDKPVLDKTGLAGLYKIDTEGWLPMQWALNPPPAGTKLDGQDAADLPSLFTIFERMGLKMEDQKEKADIVVIDSIQRPTEN